MVGRQYGAIARWQLLALGLSPGAIASRLRRGRLFILYRGVYSLSPAALDPLGELAAAALYKEGCVISHWSAAALWGIARKFTVPVEVTVVRRQCNPRDGLHLHSTRRLDEVDRDERMRIPVTSLHRTLVDLAGVTTPAQLQRLVEEADRIWTLDRSQLLADCDRLSGRKGLGRLRCVVRRLKPRGATRSWAEDEMLDLCREHQVPDPQINARLFGWEFDMVWSSARFVVEIDGGEFHDDPAQRARDVDKGLDLVTNGWELMRVGTNALRTDPKKIFDAIEVRLRERSGAQAEADP